MRNSEILVVFFGILDRGIIKTHKKLNNFVDRLREHYSITIACFDFETEKIFEIRKFVCDFFCSCEKWFRRDSYGTCECTWKKLFEMQTVAPAH